MTDLTVQIAELRRKEKWNRDRDCDIEAFYLAREAERLEAQVRVSSADERGTEPVSDDQHTGANNEGER